MPSNKQPSSSAEHENQLLLREAKKIATALGKMFAPSCEVVLHDLTHPEHAIIAMENSLSGRKIGDPATEMGLARIQDDQFPDVVQNYENHFPDGRPAKSTSIGLRNSQGEYVAALCLNLDISLFNTMQQVLSQLTAVNNHEAPLNESLKSWKLDDIRTEINHYAATLNTQPRALSSQQRQKLIRHLSDQGMLQLRGAATAAADTLGISRVSIYNALKGQ
ncbi:transcriptional regulator [Limnobaculum zhutongyuii]|uniref:Transcriptional regulator n=1 Tax=Limnobaculum zhutongyuii TaxID=2498113 RepID=A0A411WG06_9GAMM|nr:PAS domain-containing protein [Limnobaculum zhutongyuii]QBH95230.1 transcriptional regulator [Limnobaculum zhutongyuii]TQS89151.1 transcriptional regulator [Limnobaculum zhutongyuii]